MLLKKIPVSKIIPNPSNPRIFLTPKDHEYQQIEKSLETYGYVQPLIWNERSGYLVSGHQRFSVLLAKDVKEIEVVVLNLDPQQEKNLMVALNKITGRWDSEKLATMLDEFTKIPNFDCESIGFTMPEISQILDRYGEQKDADDFDFATTLDSIKEPVTKSGDLIILGRHRIMCGNSSDPQDLKILMEGEKGSLLNTDFPYNVNYMGGDRPNPDTRPKKSRKWDRIYSDNLPQEDYEAWMRKVLTNVKGFLKPGAPVYIWQGHRQFPPMYQILLELGFHVACVICWLKESFSISYADYSFKTEQCLYGWLKGASHYWAGTPGESNAWEVKRDPTKSYLHPTQKPVLLSQRAIRNSSQREDIIVDVFLGSGSCLIGAEMLNRRCYGMEIDPKYCDGIVRRYIAYVGEDKVSPEICKKYLKEV